MPAAAVVVDQLVRTHHRGRTQVTAVDQASWTSPAGAITAILGPNGAGKTTTIECLVGLQRPDAGRAEVLATPAWGAAAEHRARVGVMLQDGGLPASSKPLPLLRHLSGFYRNPWPVADLADRLGIPVFAHRTIRRLSGGERQRVALAAALIGRPDVVFLDEPSAGLDPQARREVWQLIREYANRGAAVVLTTHSFEEADRLSDHLVVMRAGQVVACGTLPEVRGERRLEDVYFDLTGGPK